MIHHSPSKPSSSSITKLKRLDVHPKITITPQRKHRKLLKDGSGHEVWPEEVENVFVQGLKDYWESPWATYSRGRSRWRNQFLVDYLKKVGVERSKKQVASHIQVLRNMWKGEPEFHLVAGGEELFLETGLLAPVKLEDHYDSDNLITLGRDEDDSGSPVSSSESFSAFVGQCTYENKTSPSQPLSPVFESYSPTGSLANFSEEPTSPIHDIPHDLPFPPSPVSPLGSGSPLLEYRSTLQTSSRLASPLSVGYPQAHPNSSYPYFHRGTLTELSTASSSSSYQPPLNRVSHLCLWTEGMPPISLAMDCLSPRLSGSQTTPMAVQLKLRLSSMDDLRSPPTLHGFFGSVSFGNSWLSFAKCLTKVYANNVCISTEESSLHFIPPSTPTDDPTVTALLPESSLSRSRWLEADLQTSITQEFVVDGRTLALVTYDLVRTNNGLLPSAELIGSQPYIAPKVVDGPPSLTQGVYPYLPSFAMRSIPTSHEPYRRFSETSLACALTPVNVGLRTHSQSSLRC